MTAAVVVSVLLAGCLGSGTTDRCQEVKPTFTGTDISLESWQPVQTNLLRLTLSSRSSDITVKEVRLTVDGTTYTRSGLGQQIPLGESRMVQIDLAEEKPFTQGGCYQIELSLIYDAGVLQDQQLGPATGMLRVPDS